MSKQTRIALVFDFDDTLAPDSTSTFLESIGINVALPSLFVHSTNNRTRCLRRLLRVPVPVALARLGCTS